MVERKALEQIIRVNQAGEYGAKRIYQGQLWALGTDANIAHMAAQEQKHLDAFNKLLVIHKVRPTLLQPLWHIGGFAMGAMSALLGKETAHACTIAVETVIDEHYQKQLTLLEQTSEDPSLESLKQVISVCREEEIQHKETAINEGGTQSPFAPVVMGIIQRITKTAIWLSSRF